MPRSVVLDLETTGIRVDEGHRIVEVGMVELDEHDQPTGRELHLEINPEREVPEDAAKVHGKSSEYWEDKPLFAEVAQQIAEFIGDAQIIITCRHYPEPDGSEYVLDINFLTEELENAGFTSPKPGQWTNVRLWSEEMWGFEQGGLNYVAERFGIDTTGRGKKTNHDALTDAKLLVDVYKPLKAEYIKFKHFDPYRHQKPKDPSL